MNDSHDDDRLFSELRAQARGYDPALPAGVHRRIVETIARAEPPVAPRRAVLRWAWAAGSLAAVVVVGVALWRGRATAPEPAPVPVAAGTPLRAPDPIALAHLLTNDPLADEVRAIVDDVTRATSTVTSVLPAAVRAKPEGEANPPRSSGPAPRGSGGPAV